jgi:glycosyltransferase involved in cell wall biosynthesis
MRVLMTTDTVGGVWSYAATPCHELGSAGIQVALAAMGGALSESQCEQVAGIPGVEVFEEHPARKLEWMDDPWEDVARSQEWLREVGAHVQPDIVHANAYAPALVPWACPTVLAAHSCVCTWWRAVKGAAAPDRYDRYRGMVSAALRCAEQVVVPTRAFGRELEAEYGLSRPPEVIANGISGPLAVTAPDASYPIVTVGRLWDEAKNIGAIVEAAGGLPAQIAAIGAVGLDAAGWTPIDAPPNVALLGVLPRGEIHAQLRAARIFVAPAKYEPFGLAILEAAQEFCALVLGDIPTLRELWGGAALFVPPDDPEAIRAALDELMSLPGRAATLGARAHVRSRRYSARRMGLATMELYARLASVDAAAAAGCRGARADRDVLSLARVGMEPRERAFSAGSGAHPEGARARCDRA